MLDSICSSLLIVLKKQQGWILMQQATMSGKTLADLLLAITAYISMVTIRDAVVSVLQTYQISGKQSSDFFHPCTPCILPRQTLPLTKPFQVRKYHYTSFRSELASFLRGSACFPPGLCVVWLTPRTYETTSRCLSINLSKTFKGHIHPKW